MNHVAYTLNGNILTIHGTSPPKSFKEWMGNGLKDITVSAQCWPNREGFHAGCYKVAVWLTGEIEGSLDKSETVFVKGHSMGGSIGQVVAILLARKSFQVELETKGAYPVSASPVVGGGVNVAYGNDIVTKLFPWYNYVGVVKLIGPKRKWWKVSFKDHMRY